MTVFTDGKSTWTLSFVTAPRIRSRTLGAASVDRVSWRLVPRAAEWLALRRSTCDKPDRSEARAVLDWRDGRLKAAEQGRNRGTARRDTGLRDGGNRRGTLATGRLSEIQLTER